MSLIFFVVTWLWETLVHRYFRYETKNSSDRAEVHYSHREQLRLKYINADRRFKVLTIRLQYGSSFTVEVLGRCSPGADTNPVDLCNFSRSDQSNMFIRVQAIKKIWSTSLKCGNHVWSHALFSRIFVFWLLKVVETLFLAQNVRNGHIYIRLMKQHMV